jgi:hypothetical protein
MTYAAKILKKVYRKRLLPPLKPPITPLLLFGPMMGLPRPITKATYRKKPLVCVDKAAKDLGLKEYIPIKQSVLEMAADMLAKGMVPAFKVPVAAPVIFMWLCIFTAVFFGIFYLMGLV